MPRTYRNPITGGDLEGIRDPQLILEGGRFYLIGTCPPYWEGPNPGVKLYSSDDLRSWRFEKLLLARDQVPPTAWYRDRFWAPEIHRIAGRYYLAFNCRNDATRFPHSCGLAASDSLTGEYTVLTPDAPLAERANDLTLFEDDGRAYAYFSCTDGIYGQEVDLARARLASHPVLCVQRDYYTWDEIGIEGPCVVKRQGVYFLFYSSWTRGYEVGCATANHPLGPWTKQDDNPIFGAVNPEKCARRGWLVTQPENFPFVAVGHNTIFAAPDGTDWIVCHYQPTEGPAALGLDPILFEDGRAQALGPTWKEQPLFEFGGV